VSLALFDNTAEFPPGFAGAAEQLVSNIHLTFVTEANITVTGTFSPEIVAITDPVTLEVDEDNVDILWSIRGPDVAPLVNGLTTVTFSLDGCGSFATARLDGDSSVNSAIDVEFITVNGSLPLDLLLVSSPGEPLARFIRGECNGDGSVDIADPICALNWLFRGESTPGCIAALNANGDVSVDVSDPLRLLTFMFQGSTPPPPPYPNCGPGSLEVDTQLGCITPPAHCTE
jgi:hypothetical protein